jgi:hypothetical protein
MMWKINVITLHFKYVILPHGVNITTTKGVHVRQVFHWILSEFTSPVNKD